MLSVHFKSVTIKDKKNQYMELNIHFIHKYQKKLNL